MPYTLLTINLPEDVAHGNFLRLMLSSRDAKHAEESNMINGTHERELRDSRPFAAHGDKSPRLDLVRITAASAAAS